jgi:hypothetical protein
MKSKARKLALNRETLTRLEGRYLAAAEGGVTGPHDKIPTDGTGPIWTGPFYEGCPSYTVGC